MAVAETVKKPVSRMKKRNSFARAAPPLKAVRALKGLHAPRQRCSLAAYRAHL
jgi:hypothetical protein